MGNRVLCINRSDMDIKKAVVLLGLAMMAVWGAVVVAPKSGEIRVVFCDVGQGDAILVISGGDQMLIDGGPSGEGVLSCLGKYMPFYDRRIEVVMLTHPDADHVGGLADVLQSYSVIQFVSVPVGRDTKVFQRLVTQIQQANIPYHNVYTGDVIRMGGVEFETVWPERRWVAERIEPDTDSMASSIGMVGTAAVLGASTQAQTNDFSIGGIVKYGEFEVMLTGDADARILPDQIATGRLRSVEILKVPHHGSKFGMSGEWLAEIDPTVAVISVGGNNRYGHPTPEALGLLGELGIRVVRTDQEGDIVVTSDGRQWTIQ